MIINKVKQALSEGKVQLGCGFGQLRSQDVIRILAAAGFQWTFIDTEHGGFDLETVQDLCRIAPYVGLCPIVRVPDLQYPLVSRALDDVRRRQQAARISAGRGGAQAIRHRPRLARLAGC